MLERLLAEIDEVLGNKTSVSAEDLEKLKYAEQVRGVHGPHMYILITRDSIVISNYNVCPQFVLSQKAYMCLKNHKVNQ